MKSFDIIPLDSIKKLEEAIEIEHHYLYRKNKIDHFLSHEFVLVTKMYHLYTKRTSADIDKLNIDFSDNKIQYNFIRFLDRIVHLEKYLLNLNIKHIVYEDFFTENNYNGLYKKIWPFDEKLKYVKNLHIAENIVKNYENKIR